VDIAPHNVHCTDFYTFLELLIFLLCFLRPTVLVNPLCYQALRLLHLFVWRDLVTKISHEQLHLYDTYREYSVATTDDRLDSGGQKSRSQQAVEVAKASASTLGQHQSPSSYSKNNSLYLHIKAC